MILRPTPLSSNNFTFKNNQFIGEISQFNGMEFERVYDDACDVGFSVISAKTGKHAVFAFDKKETDGENELIAFHFVCVTPGLKNLKAVLFND